MDKDTIVLLHGWGGSSDSLVDLEKLLSKNLNVLNLDLPGFGKEKEPSSVWGTKEYARWVLAKIRSKKVSKFHLFGHSFGGQVAVELAQQNPTGLQSLILSGPAIVRKTSTKAKIFKTISNLGKKIGLANGFSFLQSTDYKKSSSQMKKIMGKILTEDKTNVLKKINVKTLLLWGDQDRQTPLSYSKIIKENLKNSRLKIFKGVRHSLPLTHPDQVALEIEEFLK